MQIRFVTISNQKNRNQREYFITYPILKEDHFVTLNYNHRPGRHVEIRKIDSMKNLTSSYKEKLLGNIVTNVIDQSQKDTFVELASVFDLSRTILLDERIN